MNDLLNYIIFNISWPELIAILQWCWCLVCVWILCIILGIILCQWIKQYMNSRCGNNFVNVREIVEATYKVYYAYIYTLIAIIYVCYLLIIIGVNLAYDVYIGIDDLAQWSWVMPWDLELNLNGVESVGNIEMASKTDVQANSMYIGVEKTTKLSKIPLLKINNNLNLAKSTFIQ